MKFKISLLVILFVCCSAVPVKAQKGSDLVIGENLKVGMSLVDAFKLLGLPKSIQVKRGTDSQFDSVAIEYAEYALTIHALTGGKSVEGIELAAKFAGRFKSGIKIGDNFEALIEKYGIPESLTSSIVSYPALASYPGQNLFFVLDGKKIIAAKNFKKNSKLLGNRLVSSAK